MSFGAGTDGFRLRTQDMAAWVGFSEHVDGIGSLVVSYKISTVTFIYQYCE